MEVVLGHWDRGTRAPSCSTRPAAVFADPAKVQRLDHKGKWFRSRGPFTVPRSPQGRPVVIQAGQRGVGSEFASDGAIWCSRLPNLEIGKQTLRVLQGADRRIRPRSAPALRWRQPSTASRRRDQDDGRGQDGASSTGCATRRPAGAAVGGPELRLLFQADGQLLLERGAGRRSPVSRGSSIASLPCRGKQNPRSEDFVEFSSSRHGAGVPRFVGTPRTSPTGSRNGSTACCDGFVLAATHHARRLRGLRSPRGAGAAAAGAVPQGL